MAGDTDINEDNENITVDIALVPVGGKYTMDYKEAAELVNTIRPELAIPTHYGSSGIGKGDEGRKFRELVDPSIKVEILIKE